MIPANRRFLLNSYAREPIEKVGPVFAKWSDNNVTDEPGIESRLPADYDRADFTGSVRFLTDRR